MSDRQEYGVAFPVKIFLKADSKEDAMREARTIAEAHGFEITDEGHKGVWAAGGFVRMSDREIADRMGFDREDLAESPTSQMARRIGDEILGRGIAAGSWMNRPRQMPRVTEYIAHWPAQLQIKGGGEYRQEHGAKYWYTYPSEFVHKDHIQEIEFKADEHLPHGPISLRLSLLDGRVLTWHRATSFFDANNMVNPFG